MPRFHPSLDSNNFQREKRKTLTVGNGGQSLGDVAGDGLPDEPGGGASCGAQHDVRGSELLAHQRVLAP